MIPVGSIFGDNTAQFMYDLGIDQFTIIVSDNEVHRVNLFTGDITIASI